VKQKNIQFNQKTSAEMGPAGKPRSAPETNSAVQSPLKLLQRSLGNEGMQNLIQARLKIGAPNDKYEREADSIADGVMRMPDPQIQRKPG